MRYPTLARDFSSLYFGLALAFALAISGCEGDTHNNITGPTSDTFATITLAGRCIPGQHSIVCEDNSTTQPAGHVESVAMTVRDALGNPVSSQQLDGGCSTAPGLACQLEFFVPAGDYSVNHSVKPDDGGPLASFIYRNLTVGPGSSVSGLEVQSTGWWENAVFMGTEITQ